VLTLKPEARKKVTLLLGKPKVSGASVNLVEERKQLQSDHLWITQQRPSLQKDFSNKYVAVKNKEVVASAKDVYTLMTALKKKGLKTDKVAVEFLAEHPACFLL
jgi:hypothetical protein